MSDSQLRLLARRWRETGSVEDEARYLRERVRRGSLDSSRLELAAYCGAPAAAEVAQLQGIPRDFTAWFVGLSNWGKLVALRGALEFVQALLGEKTVDSLPGPYRENLAAHSRQLDFQSEADRYQAQVDLFELRGQKIPGPFPRSESTRAMLNALAALASRVPTHDDLIRNDLKTIALQLSVLSSGPPPRLSKLAAWALNDDPTEFALPEST